MITSKQVWEAMTDEDRYELLMRTEAVRDLFEPGVGHHTLPSEWALLTPLQRYCRLTDVELDKANRQKAALDGLVEAMPAARASLQSTAA